ncbi:MAG: hypothetical protein NTY09_00680 [bacterium]|nr:hypothetical protein [bacterium]
MDSIQLKHPPPGLTIGDSAVIALRGSWTVLQKSHFDPFPQPEHLRVLARFLNRMPLSWRVKFADYISASIGHPHTDFQKIDPESSARWVIDGFPQKKYPGVILGAPGLAAVFLSGLTGFPYLPQPLLYNARQDMSRDNAQAYLEAGQEIAEPLVKKYPGIEATIHFDPVHDRFLIGRVVFVRLKYLNLPKAYADFIKHRLEPGSPVILLDCKYNWLRAKVADRLYFQLGGLGGISPQEMIDESEALKSYRARWGAPADADWDINYEYSDGPESEWGSTGPFLDEAFELATQSGHKPILASHNHPGELSERIFNLHLNQWTGADKPKNVYIAVFTHTEPNFAYTTGAIPLWLPFITDDNIPLLEEILDSWRRMSGSDNPSGTVYMTLHPSFCSPLDLVSLETWKTILGKYFKEIRFPGIDPARYPSDLGCYVLMYPEMVSLAKKNKFQGNPFKTPSIDDLEKFLTPP